MAFVASEVFFLNKEVVVVIEFSKSAVEYVEVFVAKVVADFVDVLFSVHLY